jgi:hypothetical protein
MTNEPERIRRLKVVEFNCIPQNLIAFAGLRRRLVRQLRFVLSRLRG